MPHFSRLGAHVPWARIDEFLQIALDLGLIPEIAIKGPDLDRVDPAHAQQISEILAAHRVRPTIHAPFFDLNPGAIDPLVQEVTARRLTQCLELAGALNARLVVIHPGVDKWRYPGLEDVWSERAVAFFRTLLPLVEQHDCSLALENIYEESPETLVKVVDQVDSPRFGHCFDIGHWHMFGKTGLDEWIRAIGNRLLHLHLHDNHGQADEHLPVGSGCIDFPLFFQLLSDLTLQPSMTLEAHALADLELSLSRTGVLLENHPGP